MWSMSLKLHDLCTASFVFGPQCCYFSLLRSDAKQQQGWFQDQRPRTLHKSEIGICSGAPMSQHSLSYLHGIMSLGGYGSLELSNGIQSMRVSLTTWPVTVHCCTMSTACPHLPGIKNMGPRECFVRGSSAAFVTCVFQGPNRDWIQSGSGVLGLFMSIYWVYIVAVSGETLLEVGVILGLAHSWRTSIRFATTKDVSVSWFGTSGV